MPLGQLLMNNAIYIVLVALFIVIIAIDPTFLSVDNFRNILAQASTRMIIALGIGGILIVQGTDLSAGRTVGLAAVVSASLLQATDYAYRMYPHLQRLPIWVPILVAIVVCAIVGLLNGIIVAVFKVPPFIATLGMMLIVYGATSTYFDRPPLGAQPIGGLDKAFSKFVLGSVGTGNLRIPYLVIYAAIVTILMWILWNKTRFGKNMYAIGGNSTAAKYTGINIKGLTIKVYVLSAVLSALAGVILASRMFSGQPTAGQGYESDAIAAAVLGGTSFSGGIGTIGGTLIGALVIGVLSNGLNLLHIPSYVQMVIKGIVIILAVGFDIIKNRNNRK
jgi:methyl-galactoside transport system permease protein